MAVQCAVSTYSLERWRREAGRTLEDTARWIADAGADGVEFAGLDDTPADHRVDRAAALRQQCEQLGLGVAGVCVGAELLVDAAARTSAVASLQHWVDVTATIGANHMRHDVTAGPA